jgi:hypothetical protein
MFQLISEIESQKMKIKNIFATLVMPHLAYAASNALIDGIVMTNMEMRFG